MQNLMNSINPPAKRFYSDRILDTTKIKLSHISRQWKTSQINWDTVYGLMPLATNSHRNLIIDKYQGLVAVKDSPKALIERQLDSRKLLQTSRMIRTIANYLGIKEYIPHVYCKLMLAPLKASVKNGNCPWISLTQVVSYEPTPKKDEIVLHFKGCGTPVKINVSWHFFSQRNQEAIKVRKFENKYLQQLKYALSKSENDLMMQHEIDCLNNHFHQFVSFYNEQLIRDILVGYGVDRDNIEQPFVEHLAKKLMQ
ncbi:MAG: competence protein ComK [Lentilactobacillus diolivorans]|jgi:hypothetical protein|nr:competence protein ComK [Lentilactobacillus diolivorans]RRG01700.1 MAG: hypothetical protein DUD34_11120 [Lactobacillus sp.]